MLKKALMLSLALTAVALMPARRGEASNCYSECSASYSTCPTDCGASPASCWDGYLVCVDSCDRGVGPWLIC